MGRRNVSIFAVLSAAFLLGVPGSFSHASPVYDSSQEWQRDLSIKWVSFAKPDGDSSHLAYYRSHGVALCTLCVSNRSAAAHTVRLSVGAERGNRLIDCRKECTLAPGASELVCFKFPLVYSDRWMGLLGIEIDGVSKGWTDFPKFPWLAWDTCRPVAILSPSISQTAVKYREKTLFPDDSKDKSRRAKTEAGRMLEAGLFLDGQVPVAEWPDQWLAYSIADCVVLTKGEWEAVPAGVRNALLGFLQAGGCLVLAGASEADLERYDIPLWFGAGNVLSSPVPEEWTEKDFDVLVSCINGDKWRNVLRSGKASFPTDAFFVPPRVVPVYVLLFCIMLFLGPVLLVILSVRNIRIRIYWLAPCIAVGVSAVILVFALFRDGVSPVTYAQSVVYLNGKSGTQVQLATMSIMAPAGLWSPLHFGPSAEPTLVPSSYPSRYSAYGRKAVLEGEGLVLGRGWVPARTPVTFLLRDAGKMNVPMLSLDASAKAAAKVTNPYPVTIQRLLFCDDKSNCFVLEAPLAPGATAWLPRCPNVSGGGIVDYLKGTFYQARRLEDVSNTFLAQPPRHLLPPGMYLCEFEGTPFLEHPIRKGKVRHNGKTLMLGELP